jgi:phosphate starvation-inducible PhoH-like protein
VGVLIETALERHGRFEAQGAASSASDAPPTPGATGGTTATPALGSAAAGNVTERLILEDNQVALALFGERNANLKTLEQKTATTLHSRGNELTVVGAPDAVALARNLVEQLYGMALRGSPLRPEDVARAVAVLRADRRADLRSIFSDTILVAGRARPIAPKGLAQKRYVDAIRNHDIVFGIGPAGTGKTYLAMALAIRALMEKQVKRIILTRPAVEAGERLGFLPGSMEEKVSPYLRPLYDALHDMMDFEKADQLVSRGLIEVAPIAFMRGRTLNDAFVILDEAQNTTSEQMKMFLTRLGFESKAVITGDITQIDLPDNRKSGLREAEALLRGIEGIEFCTFTEVDVVRHPLVQEIIKAYDRAGSAPRAGANERSGAVPTATVPVPTAAGSAAPAVPAGGQPAAGTTREPRDPNE